jgi:C1A family cysteine protease
MSKQLICAIVAILCLSIFNSTKFSFKDQEAFKQFNKFILDHNKEYKTVEEFTARFEIFKENLKKLETLHVSLTKFHSERNEEPTFGLGITKFSDLTTTEFARKYLNLNIDKVKTKMIEANTSIEKVNLSYQTPAPDSFDWRTEGKVGPVKNQGSCGSCWAFSTIGNIESKYAIATGKNITLSEQQLVDCDKVKHQDDEHNDGCNGGLMDWAIEYLENNGAVTAKDYPYKGREGQCAFKGNEVVAKVDGLHTVEKDENKIKQALFENGPYSIAINATPLQFYLWGIFNPWFEWICSPSGLNHGVVLVGYGQEGSKKFWTIRNSWGSGWGESGYFRLIAGKNACGVSEFVVSANTVTPVNN